MNEYPENSKKLVSIPAADLVAAYNGLRDFNGQGMMFGLNDRVGVADSSLRI
jgi:hypothetical protein